MVYNYEKENYIRTFSGDNCFFLRSNGVCASGHNLTLTSYTAPTCLSDGGEALKCPTCSFEITYTANDLSRLKAYGHQYYKYEQSQSCTDDGYIQYKCNLCGDEYKTDYQNAYGHIFKCTDTEAISFKCENCGAEEAKTPQELAKMWDVSFVNKPPEPTIVNNSSYFELNNDGIINAKDFAIINKQR